jgi:PIN domain nuclease of toxin-antitoxin system
VRLLLDTCALLWLALEPSRLSKDAVAAINDPQNSLHLSDASLLEIVLKNAAGKLPLSEPPRTWAPKQLAFFHIESEPLMAEAIFRSGELPKVHADPFDRLIAAEAIVNEFTLLTPDTPLRALGATCVW